MLDNVVEISMVEDLKQRCIDYRAEVTAAYGREKHLETMLENYRAELDMAHLKNADLQRVYDKCIARLRSLGEFKI